MRVHAPVVALTFAVLGLVVANATSACTFTSTGAGGDAATPSYWEGGTSGGSSGSFGTNSSSGSFGSPSGSGGGQSGGSGSGATSSGSGGGVISCPADQTPCGNACCPNAAGSDASIPGQTCTVSISFESECENYYADETSGSVTCNTCAANANSSGTCDPGGKGGGGACSTTTCEAQCNATVSCGASCPTSYCPCISSCLQSQNTNCCNQVERTYTCTAGMCSGACSAIATDGGG